MRQYEDEVRSLLKQVDLDTTSVKKLRKIVEQKHNVNLKPSKAEFDALVMRLLRESQETSKDRSRMSELVEADALLAKQLQEADNQGGIRSRRTTTIAATSKAKPRKKRKLDSSNKLKTPALESLYELSPELAVIVGTEDPTSKPNVVKKIQDYIESRGLQDPDNSSINCDEALQKVFGRTELTTDDVQEIPKPHLTLILQPESDSISNEATPNRKRRVNNAFTKPNLLSPALAELVGVDRMGRTQVVSLLWKYIKDNNLQDPKDRRNIQCDDLLLKIFKKKKFTMFQMNSLLQSHYTPLDDEPVVFGPEEIVDSDDDSTSL